MSSKIKILDATLTELATIAAASSAVHTEKINSDNILNFSIRIKNSASAYITNTSVFELDGDYFDIAYYKKEQQGDGMLMVSVEAEHVSNRLNGSDYDVEYFTETGLPSVIFGKVLEGTGFTAGTIEFTEEITFSLQEAASRKSLLMQFVAYLGGEIEYDNFTISILTQRGSSTPKALTVGKDITIISKAVNKRTLDELGNPTVAYTCGAFKSAALNLGDVVTLNYSRLDIDVSLRVMSKSYDPYNPNNVTVEIGNYINALEDDLYRIETQKVGKDALMNGCRIGPLYGFECIRNDKKFRSYHKSDGFAYQIGDGTGETWTDKLYFGYDEETGEPDLFYDGKFTADAIEALQGEFNVVISNTTITNVLSAEKGYIAELTVDQLDTSTKVKNYLESDTSDDNYIRISGKKIELVTASTTGAATEQVTDRSGGSLYWLDETHVGITTEETDYPVLAYVYTELVKQTISFELVDGTYVPIITIGAGEGDGDNEKFFIYKTADGAVLRYVTTDGEITQIELSDFVDAKLRRVETCAIDKTAGEITLTMEGVTTPETIGYAETADSMTFTWPDGFETTVSIS